MSVFDVIGTRVGMSAQWSIMWVRCVQRLVSAHRLTAAVARLAWSEPGHQGGADVVVGGVVPARMPVAASGVLRLVAC